MYEAFLNILKTFTGCHREAWMVWDEIRVGIFKCIFASQGFSVHSSPHKFRPLCFPFMGSGMDRKPFASEDNLCVTCNKKCSLTKIYLDQSTDVWWPFGVSRAGGPQRGGYASEGHLWGCLLLYWALWGHHSQQFWEGSQIS